MPMFMQLETVARRAHEFDVMHCASRLLRLSAVAASGNAVDHHLARPAGSARVARPLRTVRGYSGGLHLRFPARTAAAGQLRGDRAARIAAESSGEGLGAGRISRVSRAHLAGEGAGRGDTNRGQGGHAAQDRGQGGSSRSRNISRRTIEPLLSLGDVEFIGEIREDQKAGVPGQCGRRCCFPIAWREPFGLVMIEAMACGTPVIALENGSVPEVLENGVTGFIVHSEQQAVDAVRRIGSLDRDRIRAEFDRRFTAHRMAQNYLKLYARLAQARRVPTLLRGGRGRIFAGIAGNMPACSQSRAPPRQHPGSPRSQIPGGRSPIAMRRCRAISTRAWIRFRSPIPG